MFSTLSHYSGYRRCQGHQRLWVLGRVLYGPCSPRDPEWIRCVPWPHQSCCDCDAARDDATCHWRTQSHTGALSGRPAMCVETWLPDRIQLSGCSYRRAPHMEWACQTLLWPLALHWPWWRSPWNPKIANHHPSSHSTWSTVRGIAACTFMGKLWPSWTPQDDSKCSVSSSGRGEHWATNSTHCRTGHSGWSAWYGSWTTSSSDCDDSYTGRIPWWGRVAGSQLTGGIPAWFFITYPHLPTGHGASATRRLSCGTAAPTSPALG